MTNEPRMMHTVVGGDLDAARAFGLTVIAKCGKVWVPLSRHEYRHRRYNNLPECEECHSPTPHRLTIDPHVVYRHFDTAGRLIYVGCTNSIKQRTDQHRKSSWWFPQVARTRVLLFPNRDYALWKEREAIGAENPRWNLKGRVRDDWTAEDYADLLYAMRQNGASEKRQVAVISEAKLRHGVDIEDIEVAA